MIKEIRVALRYPINFLCSLAMVLVFALMFSSAWSMFSKGSADVGVALSGLILMQSLGDSFWGIGFSLSAERYQGTLESFYLTPANRFISVIARSGVTFIWTPITVIICVLLLRAYGVVYNLLALLLLPIIFPILYGLGCLLAGLCLLYKQTGQILINLMQFSFMILCAFFFPFSSLPEPVHWISRAIPLSYGMDAFRSVLLGAPTELLSLGWEIALLAFSSVLVPLLGYAVYAWAERKVLEEGGLRIY
jgi:ABC-2 type transport system permease protein